jgi:hypothetical protein
MRATERFSLSRVSQLKPKGKPWRGPETFPELEVEESIRVLYENDYIFALRLLA